MDLWAPLVALVLAVLFTGIYATMAIYMYMGEYALDLPYPSDDITLFITTVSQMTIPLFIDCSFSTTFHKNTPDSNASNSIRLAFLSGTMLMTVSSLINVFVLNYYFKDVPGSIHRV
jgi:hypothetical protein